MQTCTLLVANAVHSSSPCLQHAEVRPFVFQGASSIGADGPGELVWRDTETRGHEAKPAHLVQISAVRGLVAAKRVPDWLAASAVDIGHLHEALSEGSLIRGLDLNAYTRPQHADTTGRKRGGRAVLYGPRDLEGGAALRGGGEGHAKAARRPPLTLTLALTSEFMKQAGSGGPPKPHRRLVQSSWSV